MLLLFGPAFPEALPFGSARGGAGYARSPQPYPVGTRSPSLASGASTCAANAVDVTTQSSPAARKSDRISFCMKNLLDPVRLARMDYWIGSLHRRRSPEGGQFAINHRRFTIDC